jgi:predicted Zn-dependent protease with MMP-like domain
MTRRRPPSLREPAPGLGRVVVMALLALSAGLVVIVAADGLSASSPLRVLEQGALGLLVIAALVGGAAAVAVRLAGWREPESERDFEALVVQAEELARGGTAPEPTEGEFAGLDPLVDEDFAELVRDALDELPDLLRNALAHVAVMISDHGQRHRAYGLYQGDGAHRDDHPDRIVIFRDTLRRDFGHDPDLLREQVVRTVRHELAHHVGFDELGVGRLDL